MTNSVSEIEGNDVLFIIGSNTTEAHPIIGNKMKRAARNGSKIIVIDPRYTEIAEFSTLWLPLKSGTDTALINGLLHIIIKKGWEDKEFIEKRCTNYDSILELIERYPPNVVTEITGISEELLYETAKLYANTEKAGIYYTLGITEHTTGTANVMNLANLAMVTGHLGLENSGINPLRGQNNVQGACDMGALPNTFPGYQSVKEEKFLNPLDNAGLIIYILVMAGVTYLIRMIPFTLFRKEIKSKYNYHCSDVMTAIKELLAR